MSTTLDAALARIARKADIMRMDAERHSTARQDAEEIMALVAIAQRKVKEMKGTTDGQVDTAREP